MPSRAITTTTRSRLLRAARQARQQAYAPYSKFKVGAALLTASGKIVTGCNVENASYGLTQCAERAAVAQAITTGQRRFRAIAIVAAHPHPTPCGACRQVLAEFGDLVIICQDTRRGGQTTVYQLADLLPQPFQEPTRP